MEQTLGPVLEERAERFRALMAEIEPRRERLEAVERTLAQQPHRSDAWATRWTNERTSLRRELAELEPQAVDALLGIKVCDPAMGSGHFLVHAADWLAEHLIVVLNEFPENPVLRRIDAIREQIVQELTRQEIAIDAAQLKDANLLKRMVMKRCIYGVDLNPMATELAKLSLWLDSFTVGAPLSFLNHHLKVGNSLIGAQVEEVRAALEREGAQYHMFGGPFAGLLTATELMRDVAAYTDATFQEVEQSAEKYAAFEEAMLPYKRVLDLWVSRHFGNAHAEDFLRDPRQDVLEAVVDEEMELTPEYGQAVENANELWEEKRFFHWELEFPEVFIDLERSDWQENPGFDAVVGNPPYVVLVKRAKGRETGFEIYQEIPPEEFAFYLEQFPQVSEYAPNTFALMTERAVQVLRSGGFHGFIYPSSILYYFYFKQLRQFITQNTSIRSIVQLDHVFEEAETGGNAVVITEKATRPDNRTLVAHVPEPGFLKELEPDTVPQRVFLTIPSTQWPTSFELLNILEKCKSSSDHLDLLGEFYQGVCTGNNRKWLTDTSSHPLARKVLRGRDIDRYLINWDDLYLIFDKPKMWSNTNEQLLQTFPKILIRQTGDSLVASLDTQGLFIIDSLYLFKPSEPPKSYYLLSLLNSRLLNAIYQFYCPERDRAFAQVKIVNLEPLPIRRIAFTTPAEERERLVAEALDHERREIARKARNAEGPFVPFADFRQFRGPNSPLGQWLDARLTADPEQADVVHDLLAQLAERMIALHEERQRLEKALDPFKYLERGAPFVTFTDAFADEIKYGERIQTPQIFEVSETSKVSGTLDPSVAHHDIDGLRLVPVDDQWELQAQLKLRDPDDDWRSWLYESEHSIARRWVPVYRLPLDDEKARYYQHAFEVLDQFADAKSFPGGYTRTTLKKLQLARVPAFDPDLDLTPLVELSEELVAVKGQIARTDRLIDLIVYRLYGLTEEEVAVVEGEDRE